MLRWCLAGMLFCLTLGQTLADVTVWVDMKQTGPTDPNNGAVIPRVGKNVYATYSASAGYNGKPTLHEEEAKTGETWTYDVAIGTGATGSPTGMGTGQSVPFLPEVPLP